MDTKTWYVWLPGDPKPQTWYGTDAEAQEWHSTGLKVKETPTKVESDLQKILYQLEPK